MLTMQKRLFKTTLMLINMMMINWIAHSQVLPTADDSVVISRDAQRMCVKCLQNSPFKDSIITAQQQRIQLKDSIISKHTALIELAETTIFQIDEKLSRCNIEKTDLIRKKKNGWKFGLPIGAIGGGFLGWLIGKNF